MLIFRQQENILQSINKRVSLGAIVVTEADGLIASLPNGTKISKRKLANCQMMPSY